MVGYLVRSTAGHDKGKVYVVISEDECGVFVSDGDVRTKTNPKRKNIKHVQIIRKIISINNNGEIKHSIREYENSVKQNN